MGPDGLALYHRLPVALQHLASAAYGIGLRRARSGPVYRETRRALAASERLPAAEIAREQAARLQRLVRHAVASSPFYAAQEREGALHPAAIKTPDDLRRLPPLDKATVLEQAAAIRARGVGRVRTYYTSGTSGTTLMVPIDDASRQRNYAFFARSRAWAGVEHGRSATFAGRPVVPAGIARPRCVWRSNPAMRNRLYSSYHVSRANAPTYARSLCAYRPDYIDSYPSALASLAGLLRDEGLAAPRPRALIVSSETFTAAQRELVEDVFGARGFDQYGATEQSACVSQCEHGSYHVHPEYGVVELLRDDGERAEPGQHGEIVCTSFTNDAFPLLRYRSGDVAVAGEPGCPCGRAFPVLRELLGRIDDVLVTPDGREVGRLDPVFKGLRSVREAQIVQEDARRVTVRLVPAAGYRDADGASIARELGRRLGPEMEIEIRRVESIERTASGKFRAVVNRWSGGGSAAAGRPRSGSRSASGGAAP